VLGILMRKIAVARFCRTLGTLLTSGVPILDGLEITARTSGNSIVEDAIMATRKSIEEERPSPSRSRKPTSSHPWWSR
jgi:type IV pilus assembly protein PilC